MTPNLPEAMIASFVLRFTQEQAPDEAQAPSATWRGVIRHVQSNEEIHFTHMENALAFIARYVDISPGDEKLENSKENRK